MKLIIDIPKTVYKACREKLKSYNGGLWLEAIIANGTLYEEKPKGNWIKEKGCLLTYKCSNCKKIVYSREVESDEKFEDLSRLDSYRYCPRCGADMRSTTIKGKCIDCSYKTDTCQEGLHCPRD